MEKQIEAWLGNGSLNIFGLPFAGKDTQGQRLARQFDGVLLSGGEILRNSKITEGGKAAMEAGELFPTQEFVDTVLPYLSKPEFTAKPLILSSVGRWHGEEDGVIQALEQSSHPLKAVVYLHTNEPILRKRWSEAQQTGSRGERADDEEAKLAVRLSEFGEKTIPVIDFYRSQGLLIEVNAEDDVDTVYNNIIQALHAFALDRP